MQTRLAEFIKDTAAGQAADAILRKCVHCGFCTATCPTYQITGDELDGPRGRIYLIKQMLEGEPVSPITQYHLDRCLTCRSCETTCPSGVRYGRLADIGREIVEQQVGRGFLERMQRRALCAVLPYTDRFAPLLAVGRALRPLLPHKAARAVPGARTAGEWPRNDHPRRVLALSGCVQPAIHPGIDAAAARVLDRLGITLQPVPASGCCGAVKYHNGAPDDGLDDMRRNVDAWWPLVEAGAEAILVNASACALTVKEYGEVLAHDPRYAERAARISTMTRDLSELLASEDLASIRINAPEPARIAFHAPCTLQHGQKLAGKVEALLSGLGFELSPVRDPHLCCRSAGTYSIFQPELSQRLLQDKLAALENASPAAIATANIGCLSHLESEAAVPVVHWVELVDAMTTPGPPCERPATGVSAAAPDAVSDA